MGKSISSKKKWEKDKKVIGYFIVHPKIIHSERHI